MHMKQRDFMETVNFLAIFVYFSVVISHCKSMNLQHFVKFCWTSCLEVSRGGRYCIVCRGHSVFDAEDSYKHTGVKLHITERTGTALQNIKAEPFFLRHGVEGLRHT